MERVDVGVVKIIGRGKELGDGRREEAGLSGSRS